MDLLRALDRFLDRLYGWCGYAAAALLVLLAALIVASIVSRLLGVFVPGLSEYSGYAMAAASFLAFAYTFRENGHIRVAMLLSAVHGPRRWALQLWWSRAWLTRFRYGPVEWLWRSATYRKRQPLHIV